MAIVVSAALLLSCCPPRISHCAVFATDVCEIAGDITAKLTPKLTPKPGATSFIGHNIIPRMSVSPQLSSDSKTAVVRIVNHGAAEAASIALQGVQPSIRRLL